MKLFQSGLFCFCSLSCLLVTLADSAQAQNSTNQDGSAELLVALQAPSRAIRTPSGQQRDASRNRSEGDEAKKAAAEKQPAAGSRSRSGSSRSGSNASRGGDEAKKAGAQKQPAAASRSRSGSSRSGSNASRGGETTRTPDLEAVKKRLDVAVKEGLITREQAAERLEYRKRLAQGRESQAHCKLR